MIWPVVSFRELFRSPLTATTDVTPSRAALPPKMLMTLPRPPANWTSVFSSARTSALRLAADATSRASDSATTERLMGNPPRREILHRGSRFHSPRCRGNQSSREHHTGRPDEEQRLEPQAFIH